MAVKVGGTNGLIDRLIILVGYNRTSTTSDQERIDCLNALNFAERDIAQAESLQYLVTRATVSVASSAATPPSDIDWGKDITIETASSDGVVPYKTPAEFAAFAAPTRDRITTDPACYTIAFDSGTRKFLFKPTGVTATLPITYQRTPNDLIDNTTGTGSESLLPAGYELTLLLPMAEAYLKERLNKNGADRIAAMNEKRLESFYNKFRANKMTTTTDLSNQRAAEERFIERQG